MSESVANALESGGDNRTEETAKFIRMIDKFFDALNVANLNTGWKERKDFQSPYTSITDFRLKVLSSVCTIIAIYFVFLLMLQWLTDEFIPEWENSVKTTKGFNSKAKDMMVLAHETRQGIEVTGVLHILVCLILLSFSFAVKSFVELVRFIFKIPGVKFFLSERISQDPLENFFGCQRQRGRTGENPNVQQFCKNTQALRVINSVCGTVAKGNCCG